MEILNTKTKTSDEKTSGHVSKASLKCVFRTQFLVLSIRENLTVWNIIVRDQQGKFLWREMNHNSL